MAGFCGTVTGRPRRSDTQETSCVVVRGVTTDTPVEEPSVLSRRPVVAANDPGVGHDERADAVTAAAISLAIGASGLVATRTIVLLTPEDIDAAAAKHAQYRGPGQ